LSESRIYADFTDYADSFTAKMPFSRLVPKHFRETIPVVAKPFRLSDQAEPDNFTNDQFNHSTI
jgi:hypothetical protein